MAKVAFIGLGVMGYPMAGHIAAKGHDVTVYNRTAGKAKKWVGEHGGNHAPTPREAAKDCEFVFSCVGNDDDVRAVTLGDDGAHIVTVFDLMGETRRAFSRTFDFETYIWAAILYLILVELLRRLWARLETRLTRHLVRTTQSTAVEDPALTART